MSDHPYKKIIGFLNGLDYYSEDKDENGHTKITKSAIVYLLKNQCTEEDLRNCMEMLTRNNKVNMTENFLNSPDNDLGQLFGWIDINQLDVGHSL